MIASPPTVKNIGPPAQTLSRTQVIWRTWPFFLDLCIAVLGLAAFYGVLTIARYWSSAANTTVVISHSPRMLPLYSFYSCVRILLAYLFSLAFAIGYGYFAANHRRSEPFMIAALDILQSIPVLSFLPGVMLAMVALFPRQQIGVELGSILLIFTGQVWNMAFSFYSSMKSLPAELREATSIYRLSAWQRFWQLELPYSAIGLIWNSMVSVAGGWFFLMVCEMFVLGNRDFRLPGLGSYLSTASATGDTRAIIWGLCAVIGIIVATDQLVWRPLIIWSDKFKFEQVETSHRVRSPILHLLQHSSALLFIRSKTLDPISEGIFSRLAKRSNHRRASPPSTADKPRRGLRITVLVVAVVVTLYAAWHALAMIRGVNGAEWIMLLKGAAATFLRVNAALLIASAWTIPVGVAIGFHPRLARIAQPFAQIAASVPATALFPVLLLGLIKLGGGLGLGSILLMLLGTQWYILFNVIAGAIAIPTDLREVSALFRFTSAQRWRTVILPGIFPFLLTGLVTASGGAWNASIIAEYFHLKDRTLQTLGLGAQISAASDAGQFHILLLATILMALMVVTVNRLVWRRLYKLSESKYALG
jgi:NitT/TauT family transport system permease protein